MSLRNNSHFYNFPNEVKEIGNPDYNFWLGILLENKPSCLFLILTNKAACHLPIIEVFNPRPQKDLSLIKKDYFYQ